MSKEKKKENLPDDLGKEILKETENIQAVISKIDKAEKDFVLPEKIALIRNRLIRTLEIIEE